MIPPSVMLTGGFRARDFSRVSTRSASVSWRGSSSRLSYCCSRGASWGRIRSEVSSAARSRGLAVPRVTRLSNRSRSWIESRSLPRRSICRREDCNSATASCRAWICSRSREGRRIRCRSSRAPMAVRVRSRVERRVQRRPPFNSRTSSRLRTLVSSILRWSRVSRRRTRVMWSRGAFWVCRT